jgi:translation initiation factor 2 subunit 1
MLLLKQGFPEEDELVLCTVNNIQYHSVFAKLDEYDKTGMIHISEIAPGRIRNIRDYVEEGKKVVCKILKVDKKTGHIDLSLRRVNALQKRKKIEEIKQEQVAEKVVELVAKSKKSDVKGLYDSLTKVIFQKYPDLTSCFRDVLRNNSLLEELGVAKDVSEQLVEIIKSRFKEEEVIIGGALNLSSYEPNGVEIIKEALKDTLESGQGILVVYEGGGKYRLEVKSDNYKDAEKILEKAVKKATAFSEKGLGRAEFIRKEKKE